MSFPRRLSVDDLDGQNGFAISAVDAFGNQKQISIVGDINGDSFIDIALQTRTTSIDSVDPEGRTEIIFGAPGEAGQRPSEPSFDGTDGFVITGVDAFETPDWQVSELEQSASYL